MKIKGAGVERASYAQLVRNENTKIECHDCRIRGG